MAPPNEDEYRPHPGPVNAGCSVDESPPEALYCRWVQAYWSDGLRVSECLIHSGLKAAPNPAIKRQDKAALGPFEQCGIKITQSNTAQDRLPSQWRIAG